MLLSILVPKHSEEWQSGYHLMESINCIKNFWISNRATATNYDFYNLERDYFSCSRMNFEMIKNDLHTISTFFFDLNEKGCQKNSIGEANGINRATVTSTQKDFNAAALYKSSASKASNNFPVGSGMQDEADTFTSTNHTKRCYVPRSRKRYRITEQQMEKSAKKKKLAASSNSCTYMTGCTCPDCKSFIFPDDD